MDVYQEKIQSDGSLDKLKLIIIARGDLQNEETIGDNWSTKAPIKTTKNKFSDSYKHEARVNKLDFVGEFLKSNVKHRVFVKLDSRCR